MTKDLGDDGLGRILEAEWIASCVPISSGTS